jgi:hypothetical protein
MTRTATTTTERVCGFSPGMSGPSGTMISTQKTPATAGTVPGAADYLGVDMSDRMCEVGGCSRVHYARGLCNSHYIRLRKYGDVQADKPLPLVPESRRRSPREEIATRFWSKVDRNGPLGCWIWTAQTNRFGYGQFTISDPSRKRGIPASAHRVAWELTHGKIPDGLYIDHLCRTRSCVNPDHLEPVTNRVNILRGVSPAAISARKTHCKHGHEFTPENTYRPARGGRQCIACRRARERRTSAEGRQA